MANEGIRLCQRWANRNATSFESPEAVLPKTLSTSLDRPGTSQGESKDYEILSRPLCHLHKTFLSGEGFNSKLEV